MGLGLDCELFEVCVEVKCPKIDKHKGFWRAGKFWSEGTSESKLNVLRVNTPALRDLTREQTVELNRMLETNQAVLEAGFDRLVAEPKLMVRLISAKKCQVVEPTEKISQTSTTPLDGILISQTQTFPSVTQAKPLEDVVSASKFQPRK